jgi:branched-chain amino acid transport system permease protein
LDTEIALLLAQDGLVNGAVYALLALALILVFAVTRIIFVPQGEFVTYGALTLASFQQGYLPGTIWLLMAAGFAAAGFELGSGFNTPHRRKSIGLAAAWAAYPVVLLLLVRAVDPSQGPQWLQILATLAIVVPIGPLLYRSVFQPMADASILVLMIAAVALHLVLVGIGLLAFGPEGSRTDPLIQGSFDIGTLVMSGQSLAVFAVSGGLIALLFWGFRYTLHGKALRATAVSQVGARLVGIRPERAGRLCFGLSALVGCISGVLISPITTIYYDTGFLIVLKGFIAAIIGALSSYPLAAAGALGVGLVESFTSFWSSAFKEALLFALIIPVLLWLSVVAPAKPEDE